MFGLIDCNNFYANCQRNFDPSLIGKPIIVLSNNDGAVIARSEEAKAIPGIGMGVPFFRIKELVERHRVQVYSSNYELYGDVSARVMEVIAELVPEVEVYSIDEAFIDLTIFPLHELEAFVQQLRTTLRQWTGIPVSIGVGPTKTLAKLANKVAKKGSGVFVLDNVEKTTQTLKETDIKEVWGIGRQYAKLLGGQQITTAYDLSRARMEWIGQVMTVVGQRLVRELQGHSCLPLELVAPSRKSICTSRSFGETVSDLASLQEALAHFVALTALKLRKQGSCARVMTVFLHTNRFREDLPQYNPSQCITLPLASSHTPELLKYALAALEHMYKPEFEYKKAGILVSGLVPSDQVQRNLFDEANRTKLEKLMQTMDRLNRRMGKNTVRMATQGLPSAAASWKVKQEHLSPCYTTRLAELWTVKS